MRKVDSKDLHKDKQSETQETDQSGEAERKTASVSVGGWGKRWKGASNSLSAQGFPRDGISKPRSTMSRDPGENCTFKFESEISQVILNNETWHRQND